MSNNVKKFGKGRYPSKFSFTYQDFSEATGLTLGAIKKHAQRGNFDPKDLISILEFISKQIEKKKVLEEATQYPVEMPKVFTKK